MDDPNTYYTPLRMSRPWSPGAVGGGEVQLASDDFTRAGDVDLGANWDPCTADSSPDGFEISTNRARPDAPDADCSESYNAVVWPNNQYSEVIYDTTHADGAGAGSGPCCRWAVAAKTGYRLVGNASGWELIRFQAGSGQVLDGGTGTTFAAGDLHRLEVRTNGGNVDWVSKKNGTTYASGTDTGVSGGIVASGKAGIGNSSTSTEGAIRDWAGGSL